MHILFVTPTLPVPTSGGRTRLFNEIKELSTRHQVSVISFVQPSERAMLPDLAHYCNRIELVPFEGLSPLSTWRNRVVGWSQILFDRRPRYVNTFPVSRMRIPLRSLLRDQVQDVVVFEMLFLVELLGETEGTSVVLVEQNVESDLSLIHI